MTRYFRNFLVATILVFPFNNSVCCSAGDKWTDSSGTKTVEADFVKLEGIQLTLKSSDGKEIIIPLYKLDSNSRLLARRLAKSPRTPATTDSKETGAESAATTTISNAKESMLGSQTTSSATITNSVGMKMVLIKHGNFMMGSPKTELGDGGKHIEDESPQHEVEISRNFYMGQTEVTQGQWKAVMGTEPWKGEKFVKEGENYPASCVSWTIAVEFCQRLSKQEEKQGRKYRLPTEAEWEYACRAGTRTKYSFGEDEGELSEYAWFDANAKNAGESYAHEVGRKKANGNGLHDMHGNVSEWCSDLYDRKYYANSEKVDPLATTSSGKSRVTRGGNWFGTQGFCRSAVRDGEGLPQFFSPALGFRLVLLD